MVRLLDKHNLEYFLVDTTIQLKEPNAIAILYNDSMFRNIGLICKADCTTEIETLQVGFETKYQDTNEFLDKVNPKIRNNLVYVEFSINFRAGKSKLKYKSAIFNLKQLFNPLFVVDEVPDSVLPSENQLNDSDRYVYAKNSLNWDFAPLSTKTQKKIEEIFG